MTMNLRWSSGLGVVWIVVVLLGILGPWLHSVLSEWPVVAVVVKEGEASSLDSLFLEYDQHSYNIVDIQAPAQTGRLLPLLAWIVTRMPILSPLLTRSLLNQNGIHHIRHVAATYHFLPPTHFPVHKASQREVQQAQGWHDKYGAAILHHGLAAGAVAATATSLNDNNNSTTTTSKSLFRSDTVSSPYRSIMDYHRLYRSGRASPTQVMNRWIEEGAYHQLEHLKIFACLRPELIRQQAKDSSERWKAGRPLSIWDGVPVAIKDMSPIQGLRICHGSSECQEAFEDDLPAARLRSAGAILVGTTVMTEGGVTPLGYAVFFDGPYNAFDTRYYAGGSSGGSAVAVASGLVPVSVGWDGGGSVRIPASMSGVLGLATTFGRIPYRYNVASTNVKAGPLTATMEDLALSYLLLSPPAEENDFHTQLFGSAYLPQPHLQDLFEERREDDKTLQGIRLGVFWEHFQHTDSEVYEKCLQVVNYLKEQHGAEIVNFTIPYLRDIHLSHGIKILSEFGIAWESAFYNESYKLEANTEITVMLGRTLRAGEVLAAEKLRTLAIRYLRQHIFGTLNITAIVSPMLGDKVPRMPSNIKGYGESNTPLVYKLMRFVPLANFVGLPSLSVPIGYEDASHLPIGFQIMGDAWSEPSLIRLGGIVDEFSNRRPPPPSNFFDVLEPWMTT